MLSRHEVGSLGNENTIGDALDNGADGESDFDIKVESDSLKHIHQTYKVESNQNDPDEGESNFSINHQTVLQTVANTDTDLQEISFADGEHITQFQVQMPLSLADIQSLQKINRNVLMSQAALPEETTNKNAFLTPSLDNGKSSGVGDDGKQYMTSDSGFSTDEHGNLFIKNEVNVNQDGGIQGDENSSSPAAVKSEALLAHHNVKPSQLSGEENCLQPIVYVQVESSNGETQLMSVSSSVQNTNAVQSENPVEAKDTSDVCNDDLKRKKSEQEKSASSKLASVAAKLTEVDRTPGLRTLAPRLLSFPLYAGAQAGIGIGKSLLKTYNYGSGAVQILEPGQYFEVLGRCTLCFRFSRTTSYCRAEKNHRDPKASACIECESGGLSTVVCRRKLNHTAPNAQPLNIVINTAIQSLEHVKQLCVRNYLPACFAELHSIVVHHADITFVAQKNKPEEEVDLEVGTMQPGNPLPQVMRKTTDYARGYLFPYAKEKWEQWLGKFCHQTGTNYRIRTGKRVNKRTDHHGLANHNGKVVAYRTLETQLYNCALGGKPRKRKLKDGVRKRKERGSKMIGCSAVIHTRLIETEYNWKALEITVPKVLAHLPCHDPRQNPSSDILTNFGEVLVSQINPQLQQIGINTAQQPTPTFDLVSIVADTTEPNSVAKETSPLEMRKNTKHLLLTCASLVDTIENADVITAVQVQTQELLNKLLQEASLNKAPVAPKKKRKIRSTGLETTQLVGEEILTSMDEDMHVSL